MLAVKIILSFVSELHRQPLKSEEDFEATSLLALKNEINFFGLQLLSNTELTKATRRSTCSMEVGNTSKSASFRLQAQRACSSSNHAQSAKV